MTTPTSSPAMLTITGGPHLDAFYRLASVTFMGNEDIELATRLFLSMDSAWSPERRLLVRAIVEDGTLLGGYIMHERTMRIGPAHLPVACIGAVVIVKEARGRKLGRRLMEDATTLAVERRHALLLLDGISNFYAKFGFVDAFDDTVHAITRRSIPAEVPAGYRVRSATVGDAEAILGLYERHIGTLNGSFQWSLADTRNDLSHVLQLPRAHLVVDGPDGAVQAYLREDGPEGATDVWADSPEALLALLHDRAPAAAPRSCGEPSLWWRVPPGSRVYYLLRDSLRLEMRSITTHHHAADWQARPAHVQTLLESLVPALAARLQDSRFSQSGAVPMQIGDEGFMLEFDGGAGTVRPANAGGAVLRLSPSALTQLVFGYTPGWRLIEEGKLSAPGSLQPMLDTLFPPGGLWVAGIDAF